MHSRQKTIGFLVWMIAAVFVFSAIGVPDALAAPKQKFDITVTAPASGGTITPKGTAGVVKVTQGKNSVFTLKPSKDNHLASVTIDNVAIDMATDANLSKVGKSNVYKYTFKAVAAAHSITATFEADATFTLAVAVTGTGKVTSSPGGIKCGGTLTTCAMDIKEGKSITLIAAPPKGATVTWSSNCTVDKSTKKCTLAISDDTDVSADFAGGQAASASALKIAEKVSVVDAQSSSSAVSPLKIGKISRAMFKAGAADLPDTSDYKKDRAKSYAFVNERSIEVFSTINEILCMMAQAKYDEMLNKGNYVAQIDKNQCSSNKDSIENASSESQNQTSGSDAPSYVMWTVNSSRESDTSPQTVKAWLHDEGNGKQPSVIYSLVTIKEGVTDTNPYGDFEMNFKFYPVKADGTADDSIPTPQYGFLKTVKSLKDGKIVLKFAVKGEEGPYTFGQKAVLDRSQDGKTGSGTLYSEETGQDGSTHQTQFNIAFNEANFSRQGFNESAICLDRTKFEETAWRYGLYKTADGARIKLNGGFPVEYHDSATDKDYHGWVGYYGLWLPNELQMTSGQKVKKFTYTPGQKPTEEELEVFIANGKLKKHVRKTLTLGDVKNIPLQYNEPSQQGPGAQYRVVWDGTNFKKTAKMEMNQQGPQVWTDITPVTMDVTKNVTMPELNFWSQSLSGQVRVKLDCQMPKFADMGIQMPTYTCKNTSVVPNTTIDMGTACANKAKSACTDQAGKAVDLNMICGNQFGGELMCKKSDGNPIPKDEACLNQASSSCTDPSGKTVDLKTICSSEAPSGGLSCKDTVSGNIIILDQACANKAASECRDKSNLLVKLDDVCANKLPTGTMCKDTVKSIVIMFDQACSSKSTSVCTKPDGTAVDLFTACSQQPNSGMMCKNTKTGTVISKDIACGDPSNSSCTDASGQTMNLLTMCAIQQGGTATCTNNGAPTDMASACKNISTSSCTQGGVKLDLMTMCGGGGLTCINTTTKAVITKDSACAAKATSACSDPMNPAIDLNMLCGSGTGGLTCKDNAGVAITKDKACANQTTSTCSDPMNPVIDLKMLCGTSSPTSGGMTCKNIQTGGTITKDQACASMGTSACNDSANNPMNLNMVCTQQQPPMPSPEYVEGTPMMATFTCNAPNDSTAVIFYSENMVYPTDTVPAKLRCYDNCPKVSNGVVTSQMMNFDPSKMMETAFYNYTFDATAMVLKDSAGTAVVTTTVDSSNPQAQFGMMSGPLFDPDSADNMAALKCGDDMMEDSSKNGICPWKAWSQLSVFYTWETGTNNWNKFTALKKDGSFLTFDPPLQVQYTHSQTGNKYNGSKFYLEYAGFGELQGIPGTCISFDTGEPIACGPDTRWVPEFSIPEGSEVADGANSSTKYYVLPLEKEQRMKKVDNAVCTAAGLVLDTWDLPSMDDWKDPKIGTEPTGIGAPAVIGGVVQNQ